MKLYESHPLMMQGAAPMSEPITVTYLDLDHLIETAGLTEAQKKTVHLLMQGWTEADIAEQADCSRESIVMLFKRAVKKLVQKNDLDWERFAKKRIAEEG